MAKIDVLLNECIERLRRGETVEQCLSSYPEYAGELEPLLKTVISLNGVATLKARPEFKAYAKAQVLAIARDRSRGRAARRATGLRWTWATIAVSVVAMVGAGSGTVLASARSLPGDPLYSVKTTVERAQLAMTSSDVGKAKLLANFADRRVREIGTMVEKGNMDRVDSAAASMAKDLAQIGNTIGPGKGDGAKEGRKAATIAISTEPPALVPAATPKTATAFGLEGRNPASASNVPPPATTTLSQPAFTGAGPGQKAVADSSDHKGDVNRASNADEVRQALRKQAERQKSYLQGLLEKASPKDREAIQKTIDKLTAGYDLATKEEDGQ